jgi:hypothetical protein
MKRSGRNFPPRSGHNGGATHLCIPEENIAMLSKAEKQRMSDLKEFAASNQLKYSEKDTYGLRGYFADMKLFKYGAPKSYNLMERKRDDFEKSGLFDYHYTVSTGKSSYTYRQTVYFTIHDSLMLPSFSLFPEKWHHKIGKWFGMQDLNHLTYPEFSKNYILQGPQPEFVWKLFEDPRLIDHFNKHLNWNIEGVGRFFVMYQINVIQPLKEMQKFLRTGDTLYNLLLERNQWMENQLGLDSSKES